MTYEAQVNALAQNLYGMDCFSAVDVGYEHNTTVRMDVREINTVLDELTDPQVLEPSDFGILIARYTERADYDSKQELMQFLADQKVALLFPYK